MCGGGGRKGLKVSGERVEKSNEIFSWKFFGHHVACVWYDDSRRRAEMRVELILM